jgi:hypothetical protein
MCRENLSTRNRRGFLKESLGAAVAAGCLGVTASAKELASLVFADKPATHNMLVVGRQAVFLSHLPMFSEPGFTSPHRYQVILEAAFAKAGSHPQALYLNDRKANPGTKIYTLNPDSFVLPNLGAQTLRSFNAKLFRGHLEKEGNKLLAENVQVSVRRLFLFQQFNPAAKKLAKLNYILFGKGEEIFLAHAISKAPDFDQILAIKVTNHRFSDEALGRGAILNIKRPNTILQRLKEGQQVKVKLPATRLPDLSGQEIEIKVETELYLEEGELRVPADFDTTVEEKGAGFP